MLPRASSAPPIKTGPHGGVGAVRELHRLTALSALILTRGSGVVVVKRNRTRTPGKTAARVAKAWNQMVSEAEARHESYWAAHDRREREASMHDVCTLNTAAGRPCNVA